MRTSRDVLRPLVALVVVVATVALVSNVAAYRAATTTSQRVQVPCPKADASISADGAHRTPSAETCRDTTDRSNERAADEDRRGNDEASEAGRNGGSSGSNRHVVVVTASGAS